MAFIKNLWRLNKEQVEMVKTVSSGKTPSEAAIICGHTLIKGRKIYLSALTNTGLTGGSSSKFYGNVLETVEMMPDGWFDLSDHLKGAIYRWAKGEEVEVIPQKIAARNLGFDNRSEMFMKLQKFRREVAASELRANDVRDINSGISRRSIKVAQCL